MDEGVMTWNYTNVYADGQLFATYDAQGLHFQLNDWLGTRRVTTDYAGVVEQTCASLPYGDQLNCTGSVDAPNEQHFTGKTHDTESGLDYFGARYYSENDARFMTPDWSAKVEPVPYAKLGNPQSLNLYEYVGNNPLSSVDPDGHGNCGGQADDVDACAAQKANEARQQQAKPAAQQQKSSLFQKLAGAIHSWAVANGHTTLAALLTRYMGSGEAATALKTGKIPNTDAAGNPRPTHFTSDEPMNDATAVQQKYTLPKTPTHRATVPEERVPNPRTPEAGPTTEGGGSQVVTDEPVPVSPSEITPLEPMIPVDPFIDPIP